MTTITKFWQMLYDTFLVPIRDFRWMGWMLLVGLMVLVLDPQGLQTMRIILFVLFFWFIAGMVRKIFFPYRIEKDGQRHQMNLSDFFKAALDGNIAAAIMGSTIVFFMVAVALSFIMWIRG